MSKPEAAYLIRMEGKHPDMQQIYEVWKSNIGLSVANYAQYSRQSDKCLSR